MRAGILVLVLSNVLVVGCEKHATKPTVQPIPTTVLTSFREQTPSTTVGAEVDTSTTNAPPTVFVQWARVPQQERHSVEKILQYNQQIMEGLLRRFATNLPSDKSGDTISIAPDNLADGITMPSYP